MFCPYCQRPVVRQRVPGDDNDHRWCFIHMMGADMIFGDTPQEKHDCYYNLCAVHEPPKFKPRKLTISREQRLTTVPCPLK